MKHFLLVYDTRAGRLLEEPKEYEAADRAMALEDRFERERLERRNSHIEVVLITAPSRHALERTHSRYFKTGEELASATG